MTTSRRTLVRALHAAAGILISVVAIELMPEALGGAAPPWLVVVGLCLGGVFYVVLERLIHGMGGDEETSGPWMIYGAVAIDLFSDGLMIDIGSVVFLSLALILAIGQVTADVPKGFAAIANFKDKGVARGQGLLLSASFLVPVLLGATAGYWLLRGQSDVWQLGALAFTAGILVVAAVEEILADAHEVAEDTWLAALSFIGGFALFTIVASYIGE